VTDKHQNFVL